MSHLFVTQQLGPVLVLFLSVELVSRAPRLDAAALVLVAVAVLASLLPLLLGRREGQDGTRRLSFVATSSAVLLVSVAQPDVLSLPLELGAAVAAPPVGSLVLDLALDTPDRPPGLSRGRTLRALAHATALGSMLLGVLLALPALDFGWGPVVVPASLMAVSPTLAFAQLVAALGVRLARRQLGSSPEALASNGWALLGTSFAVLAGALALALLALGAQPAGSAMVRFLVAAALASVLAGHVAMLDARRPIHAARAARRLVAAAVATGGLGAGVAALADRLPGDPSALGVAAAAYLATGALVYRLARFVLDAMFAPDAGRLLDAVARAESALRTAHTLDGIGAAVLTPLQRAARASPGSALLQTLAPARQVVVDAAGLPRVEHREPSPALVARASERPGEVIVLAPLRALTVRRPDLRPLIEALERLEALCAVPVAVAGELEAILVVPRGRRRAPVTLEEIAALERLAGALAGPIASLQAEARAHERASTALLEAARLEETVDALEEELGRLRAETRILKAGRAADRLATPAIAYSPAMRALVARIAEVGPIDAPVQVIAESGSAVEQVGHLLHAASTRRDGPFVVADCAAIRPERSMAALFGEQGEAGSHPGWLRLASGGTILLVDAPALSPEALAALAEAIASRSARPEGGASAYPLDVRLIAHARLAVAGLARVGAFDPELARRLEPLQLQVPPLRERREDLPSLVLYALDRACRTLGREVLGIEDAALARLAAYDWPGNLRELQLVIDRAVTVAEPPRVRERDLPPLPGVEAVAHDPLEGTWSEIEQRALRAALEKAGGNKSEAARLLGLKRTTFLDKLRRAGFDARESIPPAAGSGLRGA